MKVLVHYDPTNTEAYGLWWIDPLAHSPESRYLDPSGPQAARGAVIMFSKTNEEVSWGQWFDLLTARTPYSENWVVYDSMGMTPDQMLSAMVPPGPLVA